MPDAPEHRLNSLETLRRHLPGFFHMLGGHLESLDPPNLRAVVLFDVSTDFCHSGDVVQGGFVTAMLDGAMAQACLGCLPGVVNLSSLEIKTSFLAVSRAGKFRVESEILKAGHKTAFMEARLYNESGELTATASSVGKLARRKPQSSAGRSESASPSQA